MDFTKGDDGTIVIVDVDTGQVTGEIAVEGLLSTAQVIAAKSDGSIYAYEGVYFPFSSLSRLDAELTQWTQTLIEGNTDYPSDMEVRPDGDLIVAAEFGTYNIELDTKRVQPAGLRSPPGIYGDEGPRSVVIDWMGTIITNAVLRGPPELDHTNAFFRQTPPDQEVGERFDPGVRVTDFVLEPDGSLIAAELSGPKLYRLDFDTQAVDVIFESDLLERTSTIKLDPAGRIVALSDTSDWEPRIVRVDLEFGTAELIADLEGYNLSDMDLRIIPEPSSIALLVLGSLAFAVSLIKRNRISP